MSRRAVTVAVALVFAVPTAARAQNDPEPEETGAAPVASDGDSDSDDTAETPAARIATQLDQVQYDELVRSEQRCVDVIETRRADGRTVRTISLQPKHRGEANAGALSPHYYCGELAKEVLAEAPMLRLSAESSTIKVDPAAFRQPTITDTPGSQASAGQTAAVSSGQPVGMAGGSVAAVGDIGSGLQMVTALAINPATIATGDTSTSTLWTSRTVDLSIVLPLNVDPAEGLEKGFQYVGARFRVNAFPLIERESNQRDLENKFKSLSKQARDAIGVITTMLESVDEVDACAIAIARGGAADQIAHCGSSYVDAGREQQSRALTKALGEFREQVDRKYLSLEGRFDRGDLNADGAAAKDSLFAVYVSGGWVANPTPAGLNFGLNGRGGIVFYKDGLMDESQYAYCAALGVELEFVRDLRRYGISAGFEFNKRIGDDKGIETDLENRFRVGLALPVADGKTVSVGINVPADGGDPTVSMSGDWSLLLGR